MSASEPGMAHAPGSQAAADPASGSASADGELTPPPYLNHDAIRSFALQMFCLQYYLVDSTLRAPPRSRERTMTETSGGTAAASEDGATGRTVVVVGGGYAGVHVAHSLDDVADVVLVEPKDAFVHNVAALRA